MIDWSKVWGRPSKWSRARKLALENRAYNHGKRGDEKWERHGLKAFDPNRRDLALDHHNMQPAFGHGWDCLWDLCRREGEDGGVGAWL